VFSLSYLDNKTSHLWIGNETNPAVYIPGMRAGRPCSSTNNTQARRVLTLANPAVGQYYSQMVIAYDGTSANCNGMLTSLEHRFAHNYTLLVNYTWSKCLGIAPVTSLSGGVVQDPNNVRGDYGPCTYDSPHLFNGMLSMQVSSDTPVLCLNFSAIGELRLWCAPKRITRQPYDRQGQFAHRGLATTVQTSCQTWPIPALLTAFCINTSTLNSTVANPIGTFGNAGHASLRGPGYFNIDVAVSREFKIRERFSLYTRAEPFNVLNHPNFMAPNANISSRTSDRPILLSIPGSCKLP
jgi:hypothetical protein